jgi:hypothetical protein
MAQTARGEDHDRPSNQPSDQATGRQRMLYPTSAFVERLADRRCVHAGPLQAQLGTRSTIFAAGQHFVQGAPGADLGTRLRARVYLNCSKKALPLALSSNALISLISKSKGSWVADSSAAADMHSLVQFCPRIKTTPVAGPSTKRYPEVQRADQGHCWPRIPVAAPQPGISHSRPARRWPTVIAAGWRSR